MSLEQPTRSQIEEFCMKLGSDSLLVQGAGGNISWKEDDVLWVKASGTWLSNAGINDIFVPVDLPYMQKAIHEERFEVTPILKNETNLRPSIETILHALMPNRVVLHLHAIDVLSHLVKADCGSILKKLLPKDFNFTIVDYSKPGADLARNVFNGIQSNKNTKAIFLLNHGLVISGESVDEVSQTLDFIIKKLKAKIYLDDHSTLPKIGPDTINKFKEYGYVPAESLKFHSLATDANLKYIVENKWAMFPDHVVFLGPKALIGNYDYFDKCFISDKNLRPPFIFYKDIGTFQHSSLTKAQLDQLSCFYDVAVRQNVITKIVTLRKSSINELLDWDAEKYRLNISL